MDKDNSMLRVEFKNTKPVELVDLTLSFTALADSFREYANQTVGDSTPDNLRLYVKEIRSGSVIADLIAVAEQTQWILKNADVFAGFVASSNEIINFFLGTEPTLKPSQPSARQAKQIAQIIEPVAKDSGSQFNITVMDGGTFNLHQHFHINSLEANAVQNGITRYLGPQLPSSQIYSDQLMTLEQVKNDATAKSGDRGIIEAISPKAVKLQFSSEIAKRQVLDLDENPLQCIFQVVVEVRSVGGKPALYRIIEVTDVIRPDS